MAKPKKVVDPELVRRLAAMHCTVDEVARACGCSKDTLERRFLDVINEGRADGRMSLRRLQWKQAQDGNTTMLIWLGKQVLGQRDFKVDLSDLTDEQLAAEIQRRLKNAPVRT